MLLTRQQFSVPDVPHVRIYPDHADPARYYAMPDAPRVARDTHGKPEASLLLFGRGTGADMRVLGGQCTLTVTLALDADERDTLIEALQKRRDGAPVAPPIMVVNPDWLGGNVTVTLTRSVQLTGQPSQIAGNACVLSASLTAEQASELHAAWQRGLPDASVRYDVIFAAADASTVAYTRDDTDSNETFRAHTALRFEERATRAATSTATVQGPPGLTPEDLAGAMQITRF